LPFNNMSGEPEQEYFSDGMTEDIITALSKHRSMLVIARNSTFAFKGHDRDVRRVGLDLGADYLVEGSVRKSENISASLRNLSKLKAVAMFGRSATIGRRGHVRNAGRDHCRHRGADRT